MQMWAFPRLVALLLCVLVGGAALADEISSTDIAAANAAIIADGDALFSAGRYADAVRRYESAYVLLPANTTLQRLAATYRALGDVGRADLLTRRLTLIPPSSPPTEPGGRRFNKLARVGAGLFGAAYGAAIIGGSAFMIWNNVTEEDESYAKGGLLFVPLFGPFITSIYSDDIRWTIPWAVVDGGLQLVGLTLLIVGMLQREPPPPTGPQPPFIFLPYATSNGAGVQGRW